MMDDEYHASEDSSEDLTERAAAYERWVSKVLRATLEDYRKRIAAVEEECSHYKELTTKLEGIMSREENGPMEMLTDLGADCLVKVKLSASREATLATSANRIATAIERRSWASMAPKVQFMVIPTGIQWVEDPSMVFVHVALGFHVEFTLDEAVRFAGTKKSRLTSRAQELKKREADVNKDLKTTLSMIEELRVLSASKY